jgi:hypothetical protein
MAMPWEPLSPEECLRSLCAEALLPAHPDRPLFPVSLGLMAVANAFVMLGLLPEAEAEEVLTGHRLALEARGFGNVWGVAEGELTVRPGAHEYWSARNAGPAGLREVPLSVAVAGVQCPTSVADVYFEWVWLTPGGLRASFRATAPDPWVDPPPPHVSMRQAMSEISLTDDTGHVRELAVEGSSWGRLRDRRLQEWRGQATADPGPAWPPAWVEFSPAASGSGRVSVLPAGQVPVGPAEPPWPTPGECYLAALAPVTHISVNEAEAGPEDTAEIIATVAESLMAVGALPVTSGLLREPPGPGPAWRAPLESRWARRAYRRSAGFRAAEHRGLAAQLPLQQATAVIESVSARDELVSIDLYGHPWVMGEYWPLITPCFQVRAADEAGNQYDGVPGGWRGLPDQAGHGSFWLWPPVSPDRASLRVTVSTLWEAAWADVDLPR